MVILAAFSSSLTGCGPRQSNSTVNVPPANGASEITPYIPRAAMPSTENILKNGSFEIRDPNGVPADWLVSPDGGVIARGNEYDAFDGSQSVLLKTIDDGYATLNQYVRFSTEDTGKTLWVSAQAKVPSDGFAFLSIEGKFGGKSRNLSERKWPECPDNWTPVAIEAKIPADVDPGTLRVRFICANKKGFFVRVDDVRAFILP